MSQNNAYAPVTKLKKLLLVIFAFVLAFVANLGKTYLDNARYGVPTLQLQESTLTESDLTWDESIAPNYVAILDAAPTFDEYPLPDVGSYATYTDELNRPTYVIGNVSYQMMREGSKRERDDLPNPTGWPKNAEVDIVTPDGDTYHGWFWNRSHLLAKSLGGPDTKDNLVPGTRMQNVGANVHPGGMAYAETMARDFLYANRSESLVYATKPLYVNNEPIPRAVLVSLESSDGTLSYQILVYNAQKGYTIDYATGTFARSSDDNTTSPDIIQMILDILAQS